MYSVWTFNKLCLQSFLIISNDSVQTQKLLLLVRPLSQKGTSPTGCLFRLYMWWDASGLISNLLCEFHLDNAGSRGACLHHLHEDTGGFLIKWCCSRTSSLTSQWTGTPRPADWSFRPFITLSLWVFAKVLMILTCVQQTALYFKASPVYWRGLSWLTTKMRVLYSLHPGAKGFLLPTAQWLQPDKPQASTPEKACDPRLKAHGFHTPGGGSRVKG